MPIIADPAPPTQPPSEQYPPFTSKAEVIAALEAAAGGGTAAVAEIVQRLGRSDPWRWTDRGSRVN